MPVTRLRMRPWLEKQINSNCIPGLSWVNKDEKIFQIPWKHAARHGWDINKDACLFRNWAIHTGRYKSGDKETDPKTWKANFRCAMNSLPDIKEVKDKSIYKGSTAVRVYRMLPQTAKADKKERRPKNKDLKSKVKKKVEEQEDFSMNTSSLPDDHSKYTSNVFEEQETDAVSAAVMSIRDADVTGSIEWQPSIEMQIPDSTNDLYPFQVSPINPSSEEEDEGINMQEEILSIFESNSEWQQSDIDGKGFFINESGTQPSSLSDINSGFEDINKMAGEIQFRFTTDMLKPSELLTWLDSGSLGLSTITCPL